MSKQTIGMSSMTFVETVADWTEWDVAAYALGRALGLFETRSFVQVKGTFWTDNALGNGLHDALGALVRAGVLEQRDEPDDQYRAATPQPQP